jgi:protein-S-isoprenylcysteine O-methyltransferase Ste14
MAKKSELNPDERKNLIGKIIIRLSLLPVFLGLITLLPAGTFNYPEVYIYLAFLLAPMMFVLFYFLKNDPQFLIRRIKTKEKEKTQKLIQFVFTLIFVSGFIVAGFDRRFGWSDISLFMVLLANTISLLGYLVVFIVFRQNSFASRVVEVENNQTVISNGIYSLIRHPMYIGVIIMWMPIPIALGSYWALIPMSTIPFALVLRILNEESVLRRELPGYKEYCEKTKYRLIPFFW